MVKSNDLIFIQNRFNLVEPEIPHSLDREVIKQKILAREEHKVIQFEEKKRIAFRPLITIAACFVLILGIMFATNSDMFNANRVSNFNNYDEVNTKISALEKSSSVSEGGCGIFYTTLVRDEEGVEKPDVIKTDGEYIYSAYFDVEDYTNRNKVYIYKTQDNESEFVSIIDKLAPDRDGEYSDFYRINNLLIYNNRLVILLDKSNPMSADKYKRDFNTTIIKIYDISDKSKASLITEFEQSGEYNQARLIDNILYLTSDYNVETNDTNYTIPWIKQNKETQYVTSKNIVCFENVKNAQYAVISTINIDTGEQSENLKAVLGGSAKIHCTKDYMYINEYIEGERYGEPERDVTVAMKLNLNKNKFTYASEEEVKQYSNDIIDIGRGTMYQSILYPIGNGFLNLGLDNESYINDITLYDKDLNILDSLTLKDNIEAVIPSHDILAMNTEKNIFSVPVYFKSISNAPYDSFGSVIFKIENNKIIITDEIKSTCSDGYFGRCRSIIINDYIYNIDINDHAPDNEKLKVFSYKY